MISRRAALIAFPLVIALAGACEKKSGDSSSSSPDPAADTNSSTDTATDTQTATNTATDTGTEDASPGFGGTLKLDLEADEGAPIGTIDGALLAAVGHPEVTGKSDANGVIEVVNVPPGTITLMIAGGDEGAASLRGANPPGLSLTTAKTYGLKIDDVVVKPGAKQDLGKKALKETGTLKGIVGFFSNPNDLDPTGSDVFLPGTGFIVKTDADGAFTMPNLPEGKYTMRAQHTGFAVLDFDVTITSGETEDLGEVLLSLSTGPEGSISLADTTPVTIAAKSYAVVTDGDREVHYLLDYDADAALMKLSDEPAFIGREWLPVAKSGTWSEFTSDGPKTLYVMYSDLNGLESSPYKVEFIVDSEAPTISSFALVYGWEQVSATATSMPANIAAADTGTGVKEMLFCAVSDFTGCTTWAPYSAVATGLSVGGTRYLKVRDYVGNESLTANDSINLGSHTIIPSGTISGNVDLPAALNPLRFDAAIVVEGDMTIGPGVELNYNNASTSKSIKVKGRLNAQGTADDRITITKQFIAFSGFDLSESTADDNILSYFSVAAGVLNDTFVKINGGSVFHNNVSYSSGDRLVDKSGYKTLSVTDNIVSNAAIHVNSGSATTIARNTMTGTATARRFVLAGGSDTVIDHNTVNGTNPASSGTWVVVIESGGGSAMISNNDFNLESTYSNGSGGGAMTFGIENLGTGIVTATHNNIHVNNTSVTSGLVYHLSSSVAPTEIVATDNYFSGHATTNPTTTGNVTTDANLGSPWPTSGPTDCVGATCP